MFRSMFLRVIICCLTFLTVAATSAPLFAHPGHDAHAPQHGLFHWLLSPVHCAAIGLGAAIVMGVFYTMGLALRYRKKHLALGKVPHTPS
jgi:hydrogenase/urease accessory protein HupE